MLEPTLHQAGFLPISRLFLLNYRKMNISMEEAMLILHLIDHSWAAEKPFPSAEYFGKVTGKSGQTIRAYLNSLSHKGYLHRVRDDAGERTYSWAPLLSSLQDLAGVPVDPAQKDAPDPESKPEEVCELKRVIDTAIELTSDSSRKRTPVQTKPKQWRRIQSFQQKEPSQYNAQDMEFVLALAWKSKGWKTPPPRFYGRDLKHAKDLISIYGAEVVSSLLTWSIEQWEMLCQRFNIKGYPCMPIYWAFRNSMFPLYIDGDIQSTQPTWGSQFAPSNAPKEGEEIGW